MYVYIYYSGRLELAPLDSDVAAVVPLSRWGVGRCVAGAFGCEEAGVDWGAGAFDLVDALVDGVDLLDALVEGLVDCGDTEGDDGGEAWGSVGAGEGVDDVEGGATGCCDDGAGVCWLAEVGCAFEATSADLRGGAVSAAIFAVTLAVVEEVDPVAVETVVEVVAAAAVAVGAVAVGAVAVGAVAVGVPVSAAAAGGGCGAENVRERFGAVDGLMRAFGGSTGTTGSLAGRFCQRRILRFSGTAGATGSRCTRADDSATAATAAGEPGVVGVAIGIVVVVVVVAGIVVTAVVAGLAATLAGAIGVGEATRVAIARGGEELAAVGVVPAVGGAVELVALGSSSSTNSSFSNGSGTVVGIDVASSFSSRGIKTVCGHS